MNKLSEQIKARLPVRAAAVFYGFPPGRNWFIRCPFHTGDDTGSLKLYDGDRGFYCFACHAGSTVIDFTMLLFGLSFTDACRRLNDDFQLGLPVDRPQTAGERQAAREEARKREKLRLNYEYFEAWRRETVNQLCAVFRTAHQAFLRIERPEDLDGLTEAEVMAIHWQCCADYMSGILSGGTMAEKMEIYRRREEVNALCRKILNSTPKK